MELGGLQQVPLEVSSTLVPHTLVSGQGVFAISDLGDILPHAFDVLVPTIPFFK